VTAHIQIADQPEDDRYVLSLDGDVVGRADYVRRGDCVVIPHTQISPAHRGQGLGARMVRFALDDIRARGLRVEPACPFVSAYLAKHPEYNDLL
jgi:predicted GNAT family acetyltransferase